MCSLLTQTFDCVALLFSVLRTIILFMCNSVETMKNAVANRPMQVAHLQ